MWCCMGKMWVTLAAFFAAPMGCSRGMANIVSLMYPSLKVVLWARQSAWGLTVLGQWSRFSLPIIFIRQWIKSSLNCLASVTAPQGISTHQSPFECHAVAGFMAGRRTAKAPRLYLCTWLVYVR